jgi:hypothetical protein
MDPIFVWVHYLRKPLLVFQSSGKVFDPSEIGVGFSAKPRSARDQNQGGLFSVHTVGNPLYYHALLYPGIAPR